METIKADGRKKWGGVRPAKDFFIPLIEGAIEVAPGPTPELTEIRLVESEATSLVDSVEIIDME